jgi:hypothetical protein
VLYKRTKIQLFEQIGIYIFIIWLTLDVGVEGFEAMADGSI